MLFARLRALLLIVAVLAATTFAPARFDGAQAAALPKSYGISAGWNLAAGSPITPTVDPAARVYLVNVYGNSNAVATGTAPDNQTYIDAFPTLYTQQQRDRIKVFNTDNTIVAYVPGTVTGQLAHTNGNKATPGPEIGIIRAFLEKYPETSDVLVLDIRATAGATQGRQEPRIRQVVGSIAPNPTRAQVTLTSGTLSVGEMLVAPGIPEGAIVGSVVTAGSVYNLSLVGGAQLNNLTVGSQTINVYGGVTTTYSWGVNVGLLYKGNQNGGANLAKARWTAHVAVMDASYGAGAWTHQCFFGVPDGNDASNAVSAAAFYNYAYEFITTVRTDIPTSATAKWVFARTPLWRAADAVTVQAAYPTLKANVPGFGFVSLDYLTTADTNDNVHYKTSAQDSFGYKGGRQCFFGDPSD